VGMVHVVAPDFNPGEADDNKNIEVP